MKRIEQGTECFKSFIKMMKGSIGFNKSLEYRVSGGECFFNDSYVDGKSFVFLIAWGKNQNEESGWFKSFLS